MKIYAIIVTYNGTKWIDKCFRSLLNSTVPLNILAIDNGSTDGTPQLIRDNYSEVEVIETGQNLGFGKANNIGLKRVLEIKADFAFLLNQDAWIEPNTIEKLINVSNKNVNIGILSPIHLNGKGNAIDYNFQHYLCNNNTVGFYSDLYLNSLKEHYTCKFANAAGWLITDNCLRKIGGFDPMFIHYGEDDDYINRLHSAGLSICIVPEARIFHDRPQNGNMNEAYFKNQIYTNAILKAKSKKPPNKGFIIRKLVIDYIMLAIVYRGKNIDLKRSIKADCLYLKLKNKVSLKTYQP